MTLTAKELRSMAYQYTSMTEDDLKMYNLRTRADKELLLSIILEAKAELEVYMEDQAEEVAPEPTEVNTIVYDLDNDRELHYDLPAKEALRNAYESVKGNDNTWEYEPIENYSYRLVNKTLTIENSGICCEQTTEVSQDLSAYVSPTLSFTNTCGTIRHIYLTLKPTCHAGEYHVIANTSNVDGSDQRESLYSTIGVLSDVTLDEAWANTVSAFTKYYTPKQTTEVSEVPRRSWAQALIDQGYVTEEDDTEEVYTDNDLSTDESEPLLPWSTEIPKGYIRGTAYHTRKQQLAEDKVDIGEAEYTAATIINLSSPQAKQRRKTQERAPRRVNRRSARFMSYLAAA